MRSWPPCLEDQSDKSTTTDAQRTPSLHGELEQASCKCGSQGKISKPHLHPIRSSDVPTYLPTQESRITDRQTDPVGLPNAKTQGGRRRSWRWRDAEGRGHSLSAWEKTATRSAQMSKKPNQTEARRREPTSMSHQPSGGTPFFLFPSAGMAPPPVAMLPRCTTGGVAWSGVEAEQRNDRGAPWG